MKEVDFNGLFDVELAAKLMPRIRVSTDVILRVSFTALCVW